VAQNGGDRPASTESWPGDGKATHAGQSGTAATRGNGNVDKLLKEERDCIRFRDAEQNVDGKKKVAAEKDCQPTLKAFFVPSFIQ